MIWVVGQVFQFILLIIFIYYFVISIFGWFKRNEEPAENYPIVNKFALIVAAHNEEMVVGSIVRNLKELNYPKDMYDIFVIADNCDDNTAKVARENGALVHERFDSVKKGKGYSLEWMFKRLFAMEKEYDSVCIFDADNLVTKNFLLEMNKQLSKGHKVIQGYLGSKNPHDSWVSGNYSIAYWISNRIFQLPRYYLGLSCALGGTGFAMSTKVLKEIGWGATCLTEDLEFSLKLVLKNMKIAWSHEAVVYDEKPLKMSRSWVQRSRWMQGHCDCASRYFKSLLIKAIKDKDKVALDSAMYLVQPFVIVANGLNLLISLISLLFGFGKPISSSAFGFVAIIFISMYYSIVFVIAEGKMTKKILFYFIFFPIYSLSWIPIIISGFINKNKRVWVHTIHTRAIDINDVESLEKVT